MSLRRLLLVAPILGALTLQHERPARSGPLPRAGSVQEVTSPSLGVGFLRALGPRAGRTLAPHTGLVGALVALPPSTRAEDLGLDHVAPGIGRLRATPEDVLGFAGAHPELHVEVAPPLHPLMDRVGEWVHATRVRAVRGTDGQGALIGVADTGLDVVHPAMRDAAGKSRVAWLLDLSLQPIGAHPELEEKFGIKDKSGKLIAGAVFAKAEIDALLSDIAEGKCDEHHEKCAPSDEVGHGTHVAGIAAGSVGPDGRFPGVAPGADLVFVRVTRGRAEGIENDDLLRAVQFMFDRADADKRPIVANLSLGTDFGPHDGSFLWEQAIASFVGPDHPGHVVVAAAGNSGSIVESPIHQSVRVSEGTRMRVPIQTSGAQDGSVQVWITMRPGADLKVGLEGPDGEWIPPLGEGSQQGKNTSDYNAGVIYGSSHEGSPIPASSRGAVAVWTGAWPSGQYHITLEGAGMAELYMQSLGDASLLGDKPAYFVNGVREGTINLPATHPSIIGVGCTVNRTNWKSIAGAEVALQMPELDGPGGLPLRAATGRVSRRELVEGEVCWFSSAGPNALGVPKPEIAAPGALVVSALSRTATPGTPGSVFTTQGCPRAPGGAPDERCLQVDDTHGIAVGTSMSAPVVAGVVALLLQRNPTLTQEQVVGLLQGGAHRFRGDSPFDDQSGPGEVDAEGSLDALDELERPWIRLPSSKTSWLTLSAEYATADGSTPVTAILELRTHDDADRADSFEPGRLQPVVLVDGEPVEPTPAVSRRGPGVWVYTWRPPPGLGGSRVTFGATFDGAPVVEPRTVPIASDRWMAGYPSRGSGSGCSAAGVGNAGSGAGAGLGLGLAIVAGASGRARRRRRR